MNRLTYYEGAEPEAAFTEADGVKARAFLSEQVDLSPRTCPVCHGAGILQPTRQTTLPTGAIERVASGEPRRCLACKRTQ